MDSNKIQFYHNFAEQKKNKNEKQNKKRKKRNDTQVCLTISFSFFPEFQGRFFSSMYDIFCAANAIRAGDNWLQLRQSMVDNNKWLYGPNNKNGNDANPNITNKS